MSEVARKVEFDKWLEVKDVHLTERGGAAAAQINQDNQDHKINKTTLSCGDQNAPLDKTFDMNIQHLNHQTRDDFDIGP